MNRFLLCSVLASLLGAAVAPSAEPPRNPRGVLVEEVRNDQAAFLVRVDVDHPDRVYQGGDELVVRVRSAQAGYLYLLYCDAANQVSCLFPNAFETDNRIAAEQEIIVPRPLDPGAKGFRIKIGPPFGEELLKAVVCTQPLPDQTLAYLMKAAEATAARGGARGAIVEQVKSADWAEHHVAIVTKEAASTAAQPAGSRRVALCVGISDFADAQIRDLAVSHRDAAAMAETLQQRCGFERAWVLANEQATRQNIENAIRRQLPAFTRPGDTVLIYWSGHGSRCADTDGDEPDGFDEYLVPHDGQLTDAETIRRTMLLDDTFGRWLQELDGRRVLVVLDTCHSGGQGQEKSLPPGHTAAPPAAFDFLDGELKRIKDIGQRETALLASSTASQVSFERREGDLSTMTYCLLAQLQSGSEPLELRAAHANLQRSVAEYVEKNFPGTTQSPVLVDHFTAPFLLRPGSN
jgi:caspase domain-containing protein/uncharacterized protein DUF4384